MLVINGNNSPEELVHYYKKLLGKISVAFAYMNSLIANSEKIYDYSKTAMENLSEDDPLWYSWGWYSIAMAESLHDHFKESIEAYEKALEYGKKSGNIFLISTIGCKLAALESRMGLYTSSYKNCSDLLTFMKESGYSQITKSECTFAGLYTCMAGIEFMRTDLDDAFKNIKTAYSLSKNDSNSSYKVSVLLIYALTLYGRRDTAGFNKMINEAEDIIKLNKIVFSIIDIYVAVKGLFLIQQNELEKAHHFFKEMGLGLEKKISYSDEHGYVGYAFLLVIELKFEEAEILLSKLLKMAQAANRIERIIEIKIIYAILNKATGNKEKAVTNLIEAIEDAACENILMSFVLYHSEISDLLKEVYKMQATAKTKIPKKSIDKLKLAIEKREKFKKINSQSGLSDRELDALRLLAEDLSNQEIADKLFVSLNTVKTHLKNIFLKLEVNSRSGTVAKAKEMGLI